MPDRLLRDRVAEAVRAADLLSDTGSVVSLAVEALSAACPHGMALAFTRRGDGGFGSVAASREGRLLRLESMPRPQAPVRWVVQLDKVPDWQQNRWIEPIGSGVHGKDYFLRFNPLPMMLMGDTRNPPDYGRIMLCRDGRMLAWLGLYVDGRRGFSESEQTQLARVAAELAAPLRLAAVLERSPAPPSLSPRQTEIMTRVSKGMTNKQIAKDLDISPATVKTLLERLFRVSKARNRIALIQWWQGANLPDG